ncbi:hypothetical protein EUX98_g2245 [Antrodiella citrinella]|uniref:Uncharacterized protein n=1 Tax=Antrodiella citrinella TaxID=2447956 RepID=A0A4S4N1Q1_9APHY|nr:hypothetical protein EUX98_g2245 [Antrodiella citrinella]
MAPDIKFTPYGIPYLVEFANVAFGKRSKFGSSSTSLAPAVGASSSTLNLSHASTTLPSASTTALIVNAHESEGDGLLIQFASHPTNSYRRLSETRLLRLKHRIASAVVAAGMNAPAPSQSSNTPERCVSHGRIHTSELRRAGGSLRSAPSSLYHGTYGQVMSAFNAAGLTTIPCDPYGFADAQRLGALFVVRHTDVGTLELTKLTLWA